MYGILIQLPGSNDWGARVDSRNDELGVLNIYQVPSSGITINTTVKFKVQYNQRTGRPYAVFEEVADRNDTVFNTEDRNKWYSLGENKEFEFVSKIVPFLDVELIINPQKATDPTVIDLWDITNNRPADLKVQTTPFFNSGRYIYKGRAYNPQFTVTFNKKDYEKYKLVYPNSDVYFWVNWQQLSYKNKSVNPMNGVWRANINKIIEYIESETVSLHEYIYRKNDNHNAKESYLFFLEDNDIFQRLF